MVLIGKDRYCTRPHCLVLFAFRYFRSFLIKKEPDWCCPETTGTVKGMERYRRKNQNCRSLDSKGGSAGVEVLPKEVTVMGLIAGVTQKVFSCFCFCFWVTFLICFFICVDFQYNFLSRHTSFFPSSHIFLFESCVGLSFTELPHSFRK